MSEILTSDKKGLRLLEDSIVINYKLDKWVNAEKRIKARQEAEGKGCDCKGSAYVSYYNMPQTMNVFDTDTGTSSQYRVNVTPADVNNLLGENGIKNIVFLDKIASANLFELTEIIKDNSDVLHSLNGYNGNGSFVTFGSNSIFNNDSKEKPTFVEKVVNFFKRRQEKKSVEFDAVEFFTQVKFTSKKSAELYRDRVANYLKAIHNAHAIGQTALVEQYLKEMITNKYENLLDSEGFYYAITEQQIVDFVKKTEKGVQLSYISNFGRPIPEEVNELLMKVNQLEVFDNYVILYFDPKGTVYKETEKEKYKRKDPILFGVIAGSKKLYYITDWVDEYCDLTLEKFVDTLKIKKSDLKIYKTEKKENNTEKRVNGVKERVMEKNSGKTEHIDDIEKEIADSKPEPVKKTKKTKKNG